MSGLGRAERAERGFSLIETLVAQGVLAFGLLAVALVFSRGLMLLNGSGPDMIARERATDAIESVFTARDTRVLTWAQIRNVAGAGSDGGVFLDGARPLRTAGPDGLINTADDVGLESVMDPGPDRTLGTADDVAQPLNDFTREIEIRDLGPNLRQIRVIIDYTVGADHRSFVITTYISSYA